MTLSAHDRLRLLASTEVVEFSVWGVAIGVCG